MRTSILLCLLALPAFGQWRLTNPAFVSSLTSGAEAAPPAGPLVLDLTTNVFPAAYDISRRLTTNWTGPLLTVVRSSDLATNDISYSGEAVDIAALEAFVGAGNDGFIERAYDQSGNGRHAAITATNQWALIVTNGAAVLGSNGRLAMSLDGVDDRLLSPNVTLGLPITYFVVETSLAHTSADFIVSGNGVSAAALRHSSTSNALRLNSGATTLNTGALTLGQWYLIRTLVVSGTSDEIQVNDAAPIVGDAGDSTIANQFEIGDISLSPLIRVSAWYILSSLPSAADISAIQANINDWYAIY